MGKLKTILNLIKNDRDGLKNIFACKLAKSKISRIIPDKLYLKIQYRFRMGKKLNLNSPKTFNEKLQWLKLYDRKPEYSRYVDKYDAKEVVADKLGSEYIISTIGVWDSVDEIDFEALPNEFVLKCTHDSGSVVICRDKSTFDFNSAKEKLRKKLKTNLFWQGREWPYKNVKPRIIVEQYLSELSDDKLIDYKFFCFNGEPRYLYISQGLDDHETARISYAFLDWQMAPFRRTDFASFDVLPSKPVNFHTMIEMSRTLSKDIPFLRVDFYNLNGKIYFGEMTFFPGAGYTRFQPSEWDEKIGELLNLPL